MNWSLIIFSFYGLGALAVFIALIVLIFKRIKEREDETFEKRNN
jgi:hypothetical protein